VNRKAPAALSGQLSAVQMKIGDPHHPDQARNARVFICKGLLLSQQGEQVGCRLIVMWLVMQCQLAVIVGC